MPQVSSLLWKQRWAQHWNNSRTVVYLPWTLCQGANNFLTSSTLCTIVQCHPVVATWSYIDTMFFLLYSQTGQGLEDFLSFLILYNYVIPISLYVTIGKYLEVSDSVKNIFLDIYYSMKYSVLLSFWNLIKVVTTIHFLWFSNSVFPMLFFHFIFNTVSI